MRVIRVRMVQHVLTSSTTMSAHVFRATPDATVKLVGKEGSDLYFL